MEPLDRDLISGAGAIGGRAIVFRETDSTNDVAARAADGGEPEGLVIFAEAQTKGRGQFGRRWESAPGLGLWFSILLRPQWPVARLPELTPMIAVCMVRALVASCGLAARIKPPNDIYVGNRKLAGILCEAKSGKTVHVVVGVGLNVNHALDDFPPELRDIATSLAVETGKNWSRETIASAVLREMGRVYDSASCPGADITAEYEALSRWHNCGSVRA